MRKRVMSDSSSEAAEQRKLNRDLTARCLSVKEVDVIPPVIDKPKKKEVKKKGRKK